MSQKMTAPVTEALNTKLSESHEWLTAYPKRRIKDSDSYAPAVIVLETLVRAVTACIAGMPLSGPAPVGPRFRVGYRSTVQDAIDAATLYLRKDASVILNGPLDSYQCSHTEAVRTNVYALASAVLESVRDQAYADLTELGTDADRLIRAAAHVAAVAKSPDVPK